MKLFRRNNILYAIAGFYLLYLAYSLVKGVSEATGYSRIAVFIGIPVFAILGIGMIAGYFLGKKDAEEAEAKAAEEAERAEREAAGEIVEPEESASEAENAQQDAEPRSGFSKVSAVLERLDNDEEDSVD